MACSPVSILKPLPPHPVSVQPMIHALDWLTALTPEKRVQMSKLLGTGVWLDCGTSDWRPEARVPFPGVNPYLQLGRFLWDSWKGKVDAGKRKTMSCLEHEFFPVPCDAHKFVYAVREAGGQLLLLHAGKAPLRS